LPLDVVVDLPIAGFSSYFPFIVSVVVFSLRESVYLVADPSGTYFMVAVVAPIVYCMLTC